MCRLTICSMRRRPGPGKRQKLVALLFKWCARVKRAAAARRATDKTENTMNFRNNSKLNSLQLAAFRQKEGSKLTHFSVRRHERNGGAGV